MAQRIFAFGGTPGPFRDYKNFKSAEVYDFIKNTWKNIPDMPEAGWSVICVRVKNRILITSVSFRLMTYDTDNATYSYDGEENNRSV